ncbi:FkbM family methyltransferase [Achromobacter sp. NPDC058515]|uniref:FkbM family methyltransferase n=1 Tax=Achromobacter sp. NPDC058515 TaxID=3346533 RepID=UPI00364EE9BE
MFRQLAKKFLLAVPDVRRVISERDSALAEVIRLHEKMGTQREVIGQLEGQRVPEHGKVVFSHWGEDSIAQFIFREFKLGRYLDIGCYHPALYSNTMSLYRQGWTGVNVDPNPFMIEQCRALRPKDVSVNKAVGAERGFMDYFNFHDWASSNTANKKFAEEVAAVSQVDVPKPTSVEVMTLEDIINEYFKGTAPEFVNIDVEELDVDVLKSGNWEKQRPLVVAVEDIKFIADRPGESPTYRFMRDHGYTLFSRCVFTSFFIEDGFNESAANFPS